MTGQQRTSPQYSQIPFDKLPVCLYNCAYCCVHCSVVFQVQFSAIGQNAILHLGVI